MENPQNPDFIRRLTSMYETARLPVAIIDTDFMVVWASEQARVIQPGLALPDGVFSLLQGYDPEAVKAEIAACGVFSTHSGEELFAERATTFFAVPGCDGYYVAQPAFQPRQGTGTRPEGISLAVSSFGNQYRTPLTVIFSTLSQLAGTIRPGEVSREECDRSRQLVRTINQSTFQLLRSCEWISDYTRMTYGFSPCRPRRLDLCGYLRELFDAAAVLTEQLGIPLDYALPKGVLTLVCDPDKLTSTLLNLLSNACRFTRPDNHIEIRVRRRRDTVSISMSDHGLGIPASVQPRVFEPYFSYDHQGYPFAGNGLGLAIVRNCVGTMGGMVTLTSTEGYGTTVVFTLPVRDDPEIPDFVCCDTAELLDDRFSPLRVALANTVDGLL